MSSTPKTELATFDSATTPSTPPSYVKTDMISPPTTPFTKRPLPHGQSSSTRETEISYLHDSNSAASSRDVASKRSEKIIFKKVLPRILQGTVELRRNGDNQIVLYGSGGWSNVYQGHFHPSEHLLAAVPAGSGLPSPPSSPVASVCRVPEGVQTVAIKAPLQYHLEDAKAVLKSEARILTYLQLSAQIRSDERQAQRHVVAFFGFKPALSALIFEALPLNLSSFSETRGKSAREVWSTRTMRDPVVGMEQWLELATGLISGLSCLQRHHIVHADIKPANVLLRPRNLDDHHLFDPVYCDFSSSYVVEDGTEPAPISAITAEYAAPELLEAFYRRTGSSQARNPIATFTTDVFALGVTLIAPAVGEKIYGDASSSIQKLTLALRADPLAYTRGTSQAARVLPGGVVDRVVSMAVKAEAAARCDVQTWLELVKEETRAYQDKTST